MVKGGRMMTKISQIVSRPSDETFGSLMGIPIYPTTFVVICAECSQENKKLALYCGEFLKDEKGCGAALVTEVAAIEVLKAQRKQKQDTRKMVTVREIREMFGFDAVPWHWQEDELITYDLFYKGEE